MGSKLFTGKHKTRMGQLQFANNMNYGNLVGSRGKRSSSMNCLDTKEFSKTMYLVII